ncbi:hypothetical protein [Algoriphagus halophilus]|uniref:hypothetical protein n=1 Tax=Algoriphagus halophilus TaxID=226505 RepID=UPI00358DF6CD
MNRKEELSKIKPLLLEKRMKMPCLGTRKLYYLLEDQFREMESNWVEMALLPI